jgi:hypothetical protein
MTQTAPPNAAPEAIALRALQDALRRATEAPSIAADALTIPITTFVASYPSRPPAAQVLGAIMGQVRVLEQVGAPGTTRGMNMSSPLRHAVMHAVLELYYPPAAPTTAK